MIKRDRRSMSMDAGAVSLALREQQKSQTPNPGRRPPPSRRGGGVVAVGAARKFPRAKPPMPSALGNMVVASSNDVDRAKAVQSRRKEQAEAAMRSQRSAKEQPVYDHVAGELLSKGEGETHAAQQRGRHAAGLEQQRGRLQGTCCGKRAASGRDVARMYEKARTRRRSRGGRRQN